MLKRKLNKLVTRARHLPRGANLFRYVANKTNHLRLKAAKSAKVAYPSSIMIELTNLCNLKCITCAREYSYGEKMAKGSMDFAVFKKIIDETHPYVDSIGLTGLGETLLYKQLSDAVSYIRLKSKGIIIFISTNAHLPNIESRISPLIDKIDTLQISIDGIGETYNEIRGKGDFDFFLDNVKKISRLTQNTRTDLMFNVVVFEKNYQQMIEIIELAAELKIPYVYFNTMNLVATDWDIAKYDIYQSDSFIDELKNAKRAAARLGIELTTFDLETPNGFRKCGYPWNHFYITWDGYLVPCCAKPFPLELNFGNIGDEKLITQLNSSRYQDFRKLWHQNITHDFCVKCHMIDLKPVGISNRF